MKLIFSTLLIIFFCLNLSALEVRFDGLEKLNLNDIQSITPSEDINKLDLNKSEIDNIIKDLYRNDLIYDASLTILNDKAIIEIIESKIIENIYVNGNVSLKNEVILSNINSTINNPLIKKNISDDISLVKKIYSSLGYTNVDINITSESYSKDRVNLIFNISEGKISKIIDIKFIGNEFFSDRFLNNVISSDVKSFFNIFSKGSNFDTSFFEFDKNKIINAYKEYGFFNINATYEIKNLSNGNYVLTFFIIENNRLSIQDINYSYLSSEISEIFQIQEESFLKSLSKDNNFYNLKVIQKHLSNLNKILSDKNLQNHNFNFLFTSIDDLYTLNITEEKLDPIFVNKINIIGNSITKDTTIRSKINLEPGDFYNSYKNDIFKKDLNSLKFINRTEVSTEINDNLVDISFKIDENKKTGNILFGGSFSGDTGFGLGLGVKDVNLLGSGNEIDAKLDFNSEQALFTINYQQYPLSKINLKNNYSLFNSEKDLSSSYGYKVDEYGFGYGITYDYTKNISISTGFNISKYRGHSGSNSKTIITDNIGDRDHFKINSSILYDSTNDIWYPTNGTKNSISFTLNPENISDDPYYKLILSSEFYKKNSINDNFFFLSNKLGLADALSGNLHTVNVFGLGGMSFKGFDYRGIGPFDGNIYLGGNKYFTSTIGYGGSFLFDSKDNINVKLYATTGSIWDSDYSNNDSFETRTSVGISFDIMSVIPISLTYAIPIDKKSTDKTREFNFSIGTSF